MKNKKILVIGGTGFIGTSLIKKLIDQQNIVYIYLRGNLNKKIKNKNIKYIKGNLFSDQFWKKNIQNKDFFINLVSNENKFGVNIDLVKNFDVNVRILLIALSNALKFNNKIRVISFGSENQHGIAQKLPVNESKEDIPQTYFGINKLIAEYYIQFFKKNLELKCVNLRLPNVYGPSDNIINFKKITLNNMILSSTKGNVKLFKNKNCYRDYIFIDDVVDAIIFAIQKFDKLNNHFYYIGSLNSDKIVNVVKKIEKILKKNNIIKKLRIDNSNIQLSNFDNRNFIADPTNFIKLTGWKPKNNLNTGLEKTINFILNNGW